VTLTDAAGQMVPASVALEDDSTALVVPQQSLHIWSDYTLAAGLAVTSATGNPCEAVSVPFSTGGPVLVPRSLLPAALDGVTLIDGKVYGVSAQYRGLQVYELSPGPIALVDDIRTVRSPRSLVPAEGTLAFAPGDYDGLLRFRLDTAAPPDAIDMLGRVLDAAPFVRSGAWYVATANYFAGLHIVSTGGADGITPMVDLGPVNGVTGPVTSVDTNADASLMVVGQGDKISILASTMPYDLDSFTLLAEIVVTNTDVRIDDDRLFVASGDLGLSYYDLTVPEAPLLVNTTCGECKGVSKLFTFGGHVFAKTGVRQAEQFTIDGSGDLVSAATYAALSPVSAVTANDTQVFLATHEGVAVFAKGISAPLPDWEPKTGFGIAHDAVRVGDYVYVAAEMLGLLTFHWPLSGSPERVDQDFSPGTALDYAAYTLSVVGDPPAARLVLGDARGGVSTYKLSEEGMPQNPALLKSTPPADIAGRMVIFGDLAYACNGNGGVMVVDIARGASKVFDLTFPPGSFESCWDIAISGNLLFVVGAHPTEAHFRVADLSVDPKAPVWKQLAYFPEVDGFDSMALVNGQIFVTTRKLDPGGHNGNVRRLAVMSASAEAAPTLDWLSDDLGAVNVTALGDYLFVSAADLGIEVFDAKVAGPPLFLGLVQTPGNVWDVRPDGDGVLVIERNGGVDRYATGTF